MCLLYKHNVPHKQNITNTCYHCHCYGYSTSNSGSIIASALAVKSIHTQKKGTNSFTKTSATTTRSTGDGSSLSKLISCIRGTSGLTQGAVDDCYNTAYSDSFSSNGADTYGGLVPLGSQ